MRPAVLTGFILGAARGTPVAVADLAMRHYNVSHPTEGQINTVRSHAAHMRKHGVPVHVVDGKISVSAKPPVRRVVADLTRDEALSGREVEVLAILRDFGCMALSLNDIADEMAPTRSGAPFDYRNVMACLRRIAAKGIAVEKIGRSYRLARRTPSSTAAGTEE